ncbi:hypothetical protein BJV82DRAFT_666894 [Fennellomyces sp. T-0311]|nr:hypothetical protein BJV82DRAFT_666894 [Fennellomyces sp. T-0311]
MSEIALAVLRMERNQETQMSSINGELKELKESVKDQTALDRRLVNVLEANSSSHTPHQTVLADASATDARYIRHPKERKNDCEKETLIKFSWSLVKDLVKHHRERERLPALTDAELSSRVDEMKKIQQAVVLHFKIIHGFSDTIKWGDRSVKAHHHAMAVKLEEEVGSLAPCRYCVGNWLATYCLAKHWQNVEQGNSRKAKASAANLRNDINALQMEDREESLSRPPVTDSAYQGQAFHGSENQNMSNDEKSDETGDSNAGSTDESDTDDHSMSSSESDDDNDDEEQEGPFKPIAYEDLEPELQRVVDVPAPDDQFPKRALENEQDGRIAQESEHELTRQTQTQTPKRKNPAPARTQRKKQALAAVKNIQSRPTVGKGSKTKTSVSPRQSIPRSFAIEAREITGLTRDLGFEVLCSVLQC